MDQLKLEAKKRRGVDGRVISGAEAERLAQEEADAKKAQDERIRSQTTTETFRLAVPARAPIPPTKKKPKE